MLLLAELIQGESSVTVTQAGTLPLVKVKESKCEGTAMTTGQVLPRLQADARPEEGIVEAIAGSLELMLPAKGPLQTEQAPPPGAHVAGVTVSDQHERAPTEVLGTKSIISSNHVPLALEPES